MGLGGRWHHSLDILVTGVIDKERTNQYLMIAKLDDVKMAFYSSDTREVRTTQEWVAQAVGSDYLQEKTQKFWRYEEGSKGQTRWWMQLHNQTGGFHTEQVPVGCALSGQALVDPRGSSTPTMGGTSSALTTRRGRAAGLPSEAELGDGQDVDSVRPVVPETSVWTPCRARCSRGGGSCGSRCPPRSQFPAETPPTAPSPSPATPGVLTHVPSTSPGCGMEKTSWWRKSPAGSCPTLTAPTTCSRLLRSPCRRRTGTAMPAG
ncbi:unnamed protein product [Caretta caretta]